MRRRPTDRALALVVGLALAVVACTSSNGDTASKKSAVKVTTTTTAKPASTAATSAPSTTTTTAVPSSSTTVAGSPTTGTGGPTTTGAVQDAANTDWSFSPTEFRGRDGLRLAVQCTPAGNLGSIWGTGTYTDDSQVCTAAVHAGLITQPEGGRVVIQIAPGQESYQGSTANGVTSGMYNKWDGSYVFVTG